MYMYIHACDISLESLHVHATNRKNEQLTNAVEAHALYIVQ